MKLITDGLVLQHNYFNGDFKDYSGYGNNGTPSTGVEWRKCPNTCAYPTLTTGKITVADSAELQTDDELTIVLIGEFNTQTTNNRLICKQDAGGNNYNVIFTSGTELAITDQGGTRLFSGIGWKGSKNIAITFKSGTKAKAYLDGVFKQEANANSAFTKNDAPLIIGGYYQNGFGLENPLKAVLIYNRRLDSGEISQLNEWGNEQQSNREDKDTKNYLLNTNYLIDDPDILHAYDFKLYNNKIYDLVGGRDLTVDAGSVHSSTSLVGNMTDGPASITGVISDTANDEITMEFYGSFDETGNYSGPNIGPSGLSKFIYMRTVSVFDKFGVAATYDGSNNIVYSSDASAHAYVNKPVLMHGVITNSDIKFYINGEEMSGTVVITGTPQLENIVRSKISMNSQQNAASQYKQHNGWFASFDTAKSAEWVANRALQFRRTAYFDDLSDANVSAAANTGLMLENTNYEVKTGTYKIVEEEIFGRNGKIIECTSTGDITIPSDFIYGTIEFEFVHVGITIIDFIASSYPNTAGYRIVVDNTELMRLQRKDAGSSANLISTAAGYISQNVLYKMKIACAEYGEKAWYIKGGAYTNWTKVVPASGTNPVTDNTYTSSNYFIGDLNTGGKTVKRKTINQSVDPT